MYSDSMKEQNNVMRDMLHDMLLNLPEDHINVFRLMYNRDGKHERHVDGVSAKQLDWAFFQVENSLKKLADKKD